MFGAIAGDIIGSVYEHSPVKTTRFPLFSEASRFTDDTVLTLALANAILLHSMPNSISLYNFIEANGCCSYEARAAY